MINEFRPMNHLTSLQNLICTIGNLPTSYALSLSYEEQIWWLCDFLEKKVFPAIEENTNIMEETQQAFIELQQYITDYFNNLDVQEEINNKIDEMIINGSFNTIIEPYMSSVNNRLDSQDAKIDALRNGAPLAVSSISQMSDTSKVYVNTSDGKWYYYNGTNWVAGGVYQSTQIANNSVDMGKFTTDIQNHYEIKQNYVKGSVSNNTGEFMTSTTRIRTFKKIWLEKGTHIKFNNQSNAIDWSFQSWNGTSASSMRENSGWLDNDYILQYDAYYCFIIRYHDNREIEDTDIINLSNNLNIYRTILNNANRLINWYSTQKTIDIIENFENDNTSNNVKVETSAIRLWMMFSNFVEFYNSDWGTTNKTINKKISYALGNYGTVNTNNDNVDYFSVIIPNNYALVLNTLTGVISVKQYADMTVYDGLLLRNANGNAVAGAYKEIYDYWLQKENNTRIDNLENTISGFDYDFNVKAVAHRGFSTVAPENTLPAYKLAKKNKFKFVECDISFTSDGIPVLLHDATINRTSNGTGNINDLTYEQVRQYDFGSWKSSEYAGTKIPSFEEFIMLCRNIGLQPYIELKDTATYTENQIRSLVDIVNKFGMKEKVTWISFSINYLRYVKNYDEKARLGFVVSNINESVITNANSLKTEKNEVFIDANYNNLTDEIVNLCIDANIPLEVWTVNSNNAILNLNSYVTGVTSNDLIAGKILYNNNLN